MACKGSSVIVFSVVAENDILTQKPSYKIIQGIHKMPITGLACTQNGTIHTCSLDGSVQTMSVGNDLRQVSYYQVYFHLHILVFYICPHQCVVKTLTLPN